MTDKRMFQVTCRELVYVDRTYEIECQTPRHAIERIRAGLPGGFELIDEQIQEIESLLSVVNVHDENGNQVWPKK